MVKPSIAVQERLIPQQSRRLLSRDTRQQPPRKKNRRGSAKLATKSTSTAASYLKKELKNVSGRIDLPPGSEKIIKTIVAERMVELLFHDCEEGDERAAIFSKELDVLITNFPAICQRDYRLKQDGREASSNLLWLLVWQKAPLNLIEAAHKANPKAVTVPGGQDDYFPFHLACMAYRLDVMQLLYLGFPDAIRMKDVLGCYPLEYIFDHIFDRSQGEKVPDHSIVQFLVHRYPEAALVPDENGRTALACSMLYGFPAPVVESIALACPATMSVLDVDGFTPLEMACSCWDLRDNEHIISYLDLLIHNHPQGVAGLKQLRDGCKFTPLEMAARMHSPSTLRWLLDRCTPLDVFPDEGHDPLLLLHHACLCNNADTVKMLATSYPSMVQIRHSSNTNGENEEEEDDDDEDDNNNTYNDNTVLHSVCCAAGMETGYGRSDEETMAVMKVLIEVQPDFLVCKNGQGQTPVHITQDLDANDDVIDFIATETEKYILSSGPPTKERIEAAKNCTKSYAHHPNNDEDDDSVRRGPPDLSDLPRDLWGLTMFMHKLRDHK